MPAGSNAKSTCSKRNVPALGASGLAPGASSISGSRSSTSNSRAPDEVARAAALKIIAICRIGVCNSVM